MRPLILALLLAPVLPAAHAADCVQVSPLILGAGACDDGRYGLIAGVPVPPTPAAGSPHPDRPQDRVAVCDQYHYLVVAGQGQAGLPTLLASLRWTMYCRSFPSGATYQAVGETATVGVRDTDGDGQGDTPYILVP